MWRWVAGGGALLAAIGAGILAFGGGATPSAALLPAVPQSSGSTAAAIAADPVEAPAATPATREEKRFNRYDKDRDGRVTRDEYLAARRKAFAKLDTDGDGRLSFDEWALKATTKFATADHDKSGAMDRTEFATTAVKRKASSRPKCPPAERASSEES